MSHHSVKTLLQDVAKNLADNMQFGYGRRSEFNMIEDKRYPFIWLLPLTATATITPGGTLIKTWSVNLVFLDMDRADANEKETEDILDKMDVFADRYMRDLEEWYQRPSNTIGDFSVSNWRFEPLFKDDADITSGWLLSFSLLVSDNFEYCTPENLLVYGTV